MTVTDATAASFLSVWPLGTSRPTRVEPQLDCRGDDPQRGHGEAAAAGQVSIYNLSGNVDVITDVAGWYG